MSVYERVASCEAQRDVIMSDPAGQELSDLRVLRHQYLAFGDHDAVGGPDIGPITDRIVELQHHMDRKNSQFQRSVAMLQSMRFDRHQYLTFGDFDGVGGPDVGPITDRIVRMERRMGVVFPNRVIPGFLDSRIAVAGTSR